MRLPAADAAAAGRAYRDRSRELPGAAVADTRKLAHDLVVARVNVVGELDLSDGTEAVHRHADRGRDDAAFRYRRVHHAALAILALQPVGHAEHAAEIADVLAEHDDRGILAELDVHGRIQGLDHVHLRHAAISPPFLRASRLPAEIGRAHV